MSDLPKKIGILYSRGPHLLRLLHYAHQTYPDALITLYVPEGYPERHLSSFPLQIVRTNIKRSLWGRIALLRLARAQHFDLFLVMFPSAKLRLFARYSGAIDFHCITANGEQLPLDGTLTNELFSLLLGRIRGLFYYLRIKFYLNFHKIGK